LGDEAICDIIEINRKSPVRTTKYGFRSSTQPTTLHLEAKRFDAVLHAWVLMLDHLHLLVELGEVTSLSTAIARYKRSIAGAVNAVRRKPGLSVW
jgi:Transposase IS200 like